MSGKWSVVDSRGEPGETLKTLGEFDSEDAAVEFIPTLPDYEQGVYHIDGPCDDD